MTLPEVSAPPVSRHATRRSRRALPGLLVATGASIGANEMVAVLVPLLVLQRSGSPAEAGLVGAVALAAAIPALMLGGPLLDRWGRRRVSAVADVLSAAAVIALPVVDHLIGLTLASILALVALGAVFDGPGAAGREAQRPGVAGTAGLPPETVNARGEAAEGLGHIAGPALAGVGFGALGALTSLWVAGALLVLAAGITWSALPADPPAASSARESYARSAMAGLRLVWSDATLRAVALLGAIAMAFVAPLLLVMATHLTAAGTPAAVGAVSAGLAAGGLIGALAYERLAGRWSRRRTLLSGLAALTVGLLALAWLPPLPILTVLALGIGLAVGPINPVLAVILQQRTPPVALGRVVSTTWSLSLLAAPLGVGAAGLLLQMAGPTVVLLILAAGCLVTLGYAVLTPGLRHIEATDLEGESP